MPGYDVQSLYDRIPGLSGIDDQRAALWNSFRPGGGGLQQLLKSIRNSPGNNMFTQSALNMAGMASQAAEVTGSFDPSLPQNVQAMQMSERKEGTRRAGIAQAQQDEVSAYMQALAEKQQNRRFKVAGLDNAYGDKEHNILDTTQISKKSSFWDKLKEGLQIGGSIASFFDPTGISQVTHGILGRAASSAGSSASPHL